MERNRILSLNVLTTRFDPLEAEVSISVEPAEPVEQLSLRGRLHGPRSPYADTVEIAYSLKALPVEGDLLRARVVIPEANFWTPKAPFLYEGPVELWRGEACVDRQHVVHGLRHAALSRKGLHVNGQAFQLRGVTLGELTDEAIPRLREADINLLVAPVRVGCVDLWIRAERAGFFVLGQLDGLDDELLWYSEEHLVQRVSTLGWLLPQSLTRHPQLWHNAMLHLQGGRRDVLFGVKLEELPLGVLPGHVTFLVCEERFLPELRELSFPRLLLAKRGDVSDPERTPEILGKVYRDVLSRDLA
jgi:hypothetical protein